eukprot:SAG11_NODE_38689_length_251_cov_0.684211_1_plen_83_part_11
MFVNHGSHRQLQVQINYNVEIALTEEQIDALLEGGTDNGGTVVASVQLATELSSIGEEGSDARTAFETSFIADVVAALSIAAD